MIEDKGQGEVESGAACPRCRATTRYHTRITVQGSSKKYDLYDCTLCGFKTWSLVTAQADLAARLTEPNRAPSIVNHD